MEPMTKMEDKIFESLIQIIEEQNKNQQILTDISTTNSDILSGIILMVLFVFIIVIFQTYKNTQGEKMVKINKIANRTLFNIKEKLEEKNLKK